MRVVLLSGSLRSGSLNTALLRAFAQLAPPEVATEEYSVALPLFNAAQEAHPPAEVRRAKDALRGADAVVVASPEYNRSVPGVLKNFIDWTSRPRDDRVWEGKPVLVMTASPGALGGALAHYHLKHVLGYLNARVVPHPEIMLMHAEEQFDSGGTLRNAATSALLQDAWHALLRVSSHGDEKS